MNNTTLTGAAEIKKQNVRPWKVIVAACAGNAIEWYDVVVYAFFSVYISRAFFPSSSEALSLLLTLGTFAVSFFIRPIRAVVLGGYADRRGRKPAMTVTISLMFVATLIFVVMPPASVVGVFAPIAILLARLLQGFSAGGEFGSATALMLEHLPDRRGFAASWQFTSQALSTLMASLTGVWLTSALSPEDLSAWGFRIPFAIGLLVGPVGLYIRRSVPESPEFERMRLAASAETLAVRRLPALTLILEHKAALFIGTGIVAFSTSLVYFMTYIPTFAIKNLGLSESTGFIATTVGSLVLLLVTPIVGFFCDSIGRAKLMVPAALAALVSCYGLLTWVDVARSAAALIAVVSTLALFKAVYYAPMASVMADAFSIDVRGSGLAISYNVGVAVFGGVTPLAAAWLIAVAGDAKAPAYWVMLTSGLSLVAVLAFVVTSRRAQRVRP